VTQVALTSSPRVEDADRIAAMADPVIRNLEITECYADLSRAMRGRTAGAADWCTVRDVGVARGGPDDSWRRPVQEGR